MYLTEMGIPSKVSLPFDSKNNTGFSLDFFRTSFFLVQLNSWCLFIAYTRAIRFTSGGQDRRCHDKRGSAAPNPVSLAPATGTPQSPGGLEKCGKMWKNVEKPWKAFGKWSIEMLGYSKSYRSVICIVICIRYRYVRKSRTEMNLYVSSHRVLIYV